MKKVVVIGVAIGVAVIVGAVIAVSIVLTSNKTSVTLNDGAMKIKAKKVKLNNDKEVLEYINIPYATAKTFEYPDLCTATNKCPEPRTGVRWSYSLYANGLYY